MDIIRRSAETQGHRPSTAPAPHSDTAGTIAARPSMFPHFMTHPPMPPTLIARDRGAPHLVPYIPPGFMLNPDIRPNSRNDAMHRDSTQARGSQPTTQDDHHDEFYQPKTLEQCLGDAFHFNENFHPRATPKYPMEKWNEADAAGKAIVEKRYKLRAKRSQQPVGEQKRIQWAALLRRAQRAADEGRVSKVSQLFGVVLDSDEVGKVRENKSLWCLCEFEVFRKLTRWVRITGVLAKHAWISCIASGTKAWEFSANEVGINFPHHNYAHANRITHHSAGGLGHVGGSQAAVSMGRCFSNFSSFSVRSSDGRMARLGGAIRGKCMRRAAVEPDMQRKKGPVWGRMFLCWMSCLRLPPISRSGGKNVKGARSRSNIIFPPIRAGRGGGPAKRVQIKESGLLANSTTYKPVSLGLWPQWGKEEQNKTIGKLIGCSVSASTKHNYEGHFRLWAMYRSTNGLWPFLGLGGSNPEEGENSIMAYVAMSVGPLAKGMSTMATHLSGIGHFRKIKMGATP